jgi:hypothetical protein
MLDQEVCCGGENVRCEQSTLIEEPLRILIGCHVVLKVVEFLEVVFLFHIDVGSKLHYILVDQLLWVHYHVYLGQVA